MGFYRGPKIVTDGLVLYLDAANVRSYPGTGTTWNDLSGKGAHGELTNAPTFVQDGAKSHFLFNGTTNLVTSVDIKQNYVDLFLGMESQTGGVGGLQMVFSACNPPTYEDKSLRIADNKFRISSGIDSNDWQFNEVNKIFIDGIYPTTDVTITNKFFFIRTYRSNVGFTTPFRYCLSSEFMARRFKGKVGFVLAYNRELTPQEVLQNYNATKSRYNL